MMRRSEVCALDDCARLSTMTPQRRMARRLRKLREGRRMSQETLARRAGLSRTYVTRLELGQQDPSLSTLVALAKALKVSLGELVQ